MGWRSDGREEKNEKPGEKRNARAEFRSDISRLLESRVACQGKLHLFRVLAHSLACEGPSEMDVAK